MMHGHWQSGFDDMERTLAPRDYFARPAGEMGLVTHDVHREERGEPGARHVAIGDAAD